MHILLLTTYILRELDAAAKLVEEQPDPELKAKGRLYREYAAANLKQVEKMGREDRLFLHPICEECASPIFRPGMQWMSGTERTCCACGRPTRLHLEHMAERKNFKHCRCEDRVLPP